MDQRDLLDIEMTRLQDGIAEEHLFTVFLKADGGYYHAFEWSAWLLARYAERLSPVFRPVKDFQEKTCCLVGFPVSSLDKFIPNELGNFRDTGDGILLFTIAESIRKQGYNHAEMIADYQSWRKQSEQIYAEKHPAEKHKEKTDPRQLPADLEERILCYPIESGSYAELIQFVSDLKRELVRRRVTQHTPSTDSTAPTEKKVKDTEKKRQHAAKTLNEVDKMEQKSVRVRKYIEAMYGSPKDVFPSPSDESPF